MILVDSTVWIDLLRERRTAPTAILERLLNLMEAAVTLVIVQEILQGATDASSFERLRAHILPLPLPKTRQAQRAMPRRPNYMPAVAGLASRRAARAIA